MEGNGFKRNKKINEDIIMKNNQNNIKAKNDLEAEDNRLNYNKFNDNSNHKNETILDAVENSSKLDNKFKHECVSNYNSGHLNTANTMNISNWETFTNQNKQLKSYLQTSKTNSYLKTYNNNQINNIDLLESSELKVQLKNLKNNYKSILKEISELNEDINEKDDNIANLMKETEEKSRIYKSVSTRQMSNNNYENAFNENNNKSINFNNSNIQKENTSINFNLNENENNLIPKINKFNESKNNNECKNNIDIDNNAENNDEKESNQINDGKLSLLELKSQLTNLNRIHQKDKKDLIEKIQLERKKQLELIESKHAERLNKYKEEKDKTIVDLQNLILSKQEKLTKVLTKNNYNEESADKDYFLYIHNQLHEFKVSQLRNKFSTEVLQMKEIIHNANQIENSFYEDLSKKESNGNKASEIECIVKEIEAVLTSHSSYMESIVNPNSKSGYAPNLNLNIYGSLCSMLNSQNKEASSRLYSSSSRKIFQNQIGGKKNKKAKEINPLSSNRYSQASISDQIESDLEKEIKDSEVKESNKLKKTKYQSDKKGGKSERNVLKNSREKEDEIENYGSQINEFSHRRIENKLSKSKRRINKNRSQESEDFSVDYSSYDVDFDEINDEIKINKVNSMRIDTEFFEKKNNLGKKLKS